MPEFYFDIKAREVTTKHYKDSIYDPEHETSSWSWPPVWSGRIEATDRNEARKLIEADYNQKFIMRDGVNVKEMPFLLSIKPIYLKI